MNQLTAGLIVVIGILGGFYVGAKYGQGHPPPSTTPTAATNTTTGAGGLGTGGGTGTGRGFGGGGGGGGGFAPAAAGQITAVDGNTITVQDRTSGKAIKVDAASARITKTTQGTTADLTQNEAVTVIGQTGQDGTVTAQTISIGGGGGGGFGGGRQGAPSPSPGG